METKINTEEKLFCVKTDLIFKSKDDINKYLHSNGLKDSKLIFNKEDLDRGYVQFDKKLRIDLTIIPSYHLTNTYCYVDDVVFVGSQFIISNISNYLIDTPALDISEMVEFKDLKTAFLFDKEKLMEEAHNVTADTIGCFIRNLLNKDRKFDYGSIVYAAAIAGLAGVHAVDNDKINGGLTGFQSSYLSNIIFSEINNIKCPWYLTTVDTLYTHGDKNDDRNPLYGLLHPSLLIQKQFIDYAIENLFPKSYGFEFSILDVTSGLERLCKAANVLNKDFSAFSLLDFNLNEKEAAELDTYIESKLKSTETHKIIDLLIRAKSIDKYLVDCKAIYKDIKYPVVKITKYGTTDRMMLINKIESIIKKYNLNISIDNEKDQIDKMVNCIKDHQLYCIKKSHEDELSAPGPCDY